MTLLIDLATAFLVLGLSTSIVAAAARWGLRPVLEELPAGWQARIGLSALLAPLIVGVLGIAIALLPSAWHVMGLGSDHCSRMPGHVHAHLCFVHQPAVGSGVHAAVVASFVTLLLARVGLVIRAAWRTRRLFMSIVTTSAPQPLGANVYLLDSDIPICTAVGLLRPTVYVSKGAAAALGPDCLDAAVGHEYGHIWRNETRFRAVAAFAAIFHAPYLGRFLLRKWHEDSEFVCDVFAARHTGSPVLVANALVRFQRALLRGGTSPVCAGARLCDQRSALTPRVLRLLMLESEASRAHELDAGRLVFGISLITLLIGAVVQAQTLHHALESCVGALVQVLR